MVVTVNCQMNVKTFTTLFSQAGNPAELGKEVQLFQLG